MIQKKVLIDYRTPEKICRRLELEQISLLFTNRHPRLSAPVDGHPDMMFHRVSEQICVMDPDFFKAFYEEYKEVLKPTDWNKVRVGEKLLTEKYPGDIGYNVLRMGNVAFGRIDEIDPVLKQSLENEGIRLIKVNQGYGKCSVAVVSDTHGITSDEGLYKAMTAEGINTLWIPAGGVLLPGYRYGFIGGASGIVGETFFLTGKFVDDVINKRIEAFVKEAGKQLCYLSEDLILDIGSILEW